MAAYHRLYVWVASYGGDMNNAAIPAGSCSDPNESNVTALTRRLATTSEQGTGIPGGRSPIR